MLIVANWKMNGDKLFVNNYIDAISDYKGSNEAIICPPYVYLQQVIDRLSAKNNKSIKVSAQSCSIHENGAYTGQVSLDMLLDCKCDFVIQGHIEDRNSNNYSSDILFKNVKSILQKGLSVIFCIGELEEGDKEFLAELILLSKYVKDCLGSHSDKLIIAYEPVWAIGSSKIPDINSIHDVVVEIKDILNVHQLYDTKVLYGGSVSLSNYKDILSVKKLDGLMIGSKSIDYSTILKILE